MHHLPVQLTRFIGREREIATVRQLLQQTRLLTITGAGGSGKTRLALEVAARVAAEYADGLTWVELGALADPVMLPHQVAATLGIREEPGRSATEALLDFLGSRSLLLVLDNCEHLADSCATLADTLLRGCPRLEVLATSREALGVAGERAWLVPPLSLPAADAATTPERLAGFEAVQLFVERAQDVLPSFALTAQNAAAIAQICQRLDGIPLAIELAAARVKVLSPEQIARRLDNVFALLTSGSRMALPRHRTLRATLEWSYHLLSGPEQLLLQRLSVFTSGFTLEAAEVVCADASLEAWEVLDLLASLVDRSLVVMREQEGAARYHLLETVRQYGQERRIADAAADAAARRRHAEYYTELAERVLPALERTGSAESLDQLRLERDNFRAALHWSLSARHDLALALRLVAALWLYWFHTNQWSEGASWSEALVAASPGRTPSVSWVNGLNGAATFAYMARDIALCRLRVEEAEAMSRALGNRQLLALTCYRLAYLFCDLGDGDLALAYAEEAVRLAREGGEPWVLAEVLVYALAFVHRVQGRPELAEQALAEAEEIAHQVDARLALTEGRRSRALLALQRGDVESAAEHARGAFEAAGRLGNHWLLSRALLIAAAAAVHANDGAGAARLLGCGAALCEAMGTQPFPHDQAFYEEVLEAVERVLDEEEYRRCWGEGSGMQLEQVARLLTSLAAPEQSQAPVILTEPAAAPIAPVPPGPHETGVSAAPRVLALGPLEIYREDELLPASAWPYAKPRELLLYLLAHPEGRTREQIGLVFWPDSSAAQVKNSFHVTLHHLRKALGASEWVVHENERYRINPALDVEFDAVLFEQQITAALRQVRAGSGSIDTLRSVLALYRGDFLQDETVGDWHLEARDHLRRLYIEGLFALGELLMQAERWAEAAEVYQRVVRKEDLHEEAHRRLMLCLARAGERSRALEHFERLVVLLQAELDAEPEEETTALYERLKEAVPV